MRFIYSFIIGALLGVGSVFLHASIPPFGLLFVLAATATGVWCIGRKWGSRTLRITAAIAWTAVALRAGFPGINDEYLISGNSIGISLMNLGVLSLVVAILLPA